MAITADEYELPLSTGETVRELAKNMGLKDSSLFCLYKLKGVSRYKWNGQHYRVVRVEE